jgi:hypothetical protein
LIIGYFLLVFWIWEARKLENKHWCYRCESPGSTVMIIPCFEVAVRIKLTKTQGFCMCRDLHLLIVQLPVLTWYKCFERSNNFMSATTANHNCKSRYTSKLLMCAGTYNYYLSPSLIRVLQSCNSKMSALVFPGSKYLPRSQIKTCRIHLLCIVVSDFPYSMNVINYPKCPFLVKVLI